MSKVLVECRSADWITEMGALLADGLSTPAWFIDTAEVAWPVGRVDAARGVLS